MTGPLLQIWDDLDPDAVALVDARHTLTWEAADRVVDQTARAILAGPDVPGSPRRAIVFAENSVHTLLAYASLFVAGAPAVPVSSKLGPDELAHVVDDCRPDIVFTSRSTYDTARAAVTALGRHIEVVAWDVDVEPDLIPTPTSGGDVPRVEWSTVTSAAMVQYTSGTTGRPKATAAPRAIHPVGVPIPDLLRHFSTRDRRAAPRPHLLVSPMYHGLGLASVRAFLGGEQVVVLDRFDPVTVLEMIERHRIHSMRMVPTHFSRLLALPAETKDRYDVSSVSFVAHSGSACPVDVKQAMIDWFGPILTEVYGATEMGTASMIDSEEWLRHPGSVGRAVPDVRALVLDDDDRELPRGRVGRLFFEAEPGRVEFIGDPDKSRSVHVRPGVFTMGDRGYVDDDGYIYITGRDADIVVCGGVNLYPAEADDVLLGLDAVADAACVGVPDPDLGEVLVALVVPADRERPPAEHDLLDACASRIARFKCPRAIHLVEQLGRTETGKLNRTELRDRFVADLADRRDLTEQPC